MKLTYFELLSPDPVQIPSVGGIKSPTLREISSSGRAPTGIIWQSFLWICPPICP